MRKTQEMQAPIKVLTSMSHKRRQRQKYRVLKAQEYLASLNKYEFAALLTALDNLDEFDPGAAMVKWPREPTIWEKIKQFLFGSKDAKDS